MSRTYDLFISYSSKDRPFVERLAEALRARDLSLWYDQWEMRPGDRLRDRINSGIARSRYFLVALTPNSVDAPWVKAELDAAMLKELDRRHVVVIPVVFGDLDTTVLPSDLKGKHYVDFRDEARFTTNVERIAALFELEKRERRRTLRELRAGALGHPAPIEYLRRSATTGHDQTQQVAALTGLQKHDSPAAVSAVAERLLDNWGVAAIKKAIVSCGKLHRAGGLGVLAATLFYDNRFISEKLEVIRSAPAGDASGALNGLGDVAELFIEPSRVNGWMETMLASTFPDLRYGAAFGSQFYGIAGWQASLVSPAPDDLLAEATAWMEARVPGIGDIFEARLRRKSTFGGPPPPLY